MESGVPYVAAHDEDSVLHRVANMASMLAEGSRGDPSGAVEGSAQFGDDGGGNDDDHVTARRDNGTAVRDDDADDNNNDDRINPAGGSRRAGVRQGKLTIFGGIVLTRVEEDAVFERMYAQNIGGVRTKIDAARRPAAAAAPAQGAASGRDNGRKRKHASVADATDESPYFAPPLRRAAHSPTMERVIEASLNADVSRDGLVDGDPVATAQDGDGDGDGGGGNSAQSVRTELTRRGTRVTLVRGWRTARDAMEQRADTRELFLVSMPRDVLLLPVFVYRLSVRTTSATDAVTAGAQTFGIAPVQLPLRGSVAEHICISQRTVDAGLMSALVAGATAALGDNDYEALMQALAIDFHGYAHWTHAAPPPPEQQALLQSPHTNNNDHHPWRGLFRRSAQAAAYWHFESMDLLYYWHPLATGLLEIVDELALDVLCDAVRYRPHELCMGTYIEKCINALPAAGGGVPWCARQLPAYVPRLGCTVGARDMPVQILLRMLTPKTHRDAARLYPLATCASHRPDVQLAVAVYTVVLRYQLYRVGNTFLTRRNIEHLLQRDAGLARDEVRKHLPEALRLLTSDDEYGVVVARTPIPDTDCTYALSRVYSTDNAVAGLIVDTARNAAERPIAVDRPNSDGLNQDQANAVTRALMGAVTVITGKPGTGKTYSMRRLAQAFVRHHPEHMVVLTPTGMAAEQLRRVLYAPGDGAPLDRVPVMTMAMFVVRCKFQADVAAWARQLRIVIIDEVSMIPSTTLGKLRKHVPNLQRLVFVGDNGQFAPIECGTPLRDLLAFLGGTGPAAGVPPANAEAIVALTKNQRNEARIFDFGDGILKRIDAGVLASQIVQVADPLQRVIDPAHTLHAVSGAALQMNPTLAGTAFTYEAVRKLIPVLIRDTGGDPHAITVLAAFRADAAAANEAMTLYLRQLRGRTAASAHDICIGDRIMFLHNHARTCDPVLDGDGEKHAAGDGEKDTGDSGGGGTKTLALRELMQRLSGGVCTGQRCTVEAIVDGTLVVRTTDGLNRVLYIDTRRHVPLKDIALGNAFTTHKAQGNTLDVVVIVLPYPPREHWRQQLGEHPPLRPQFMDTQRMVYVGATRARRHVVVVYHSELPTTLKQLIHTPEHRFNSGVYNLLLPHVLEWPGLTAQALRQVRLVQRTDDVSEEDVAAGAWASASQGSVTWRDIVRDLHMTNDEIAAALERYAPSERVLGTREIHIDKMPFMRRVGVNVVRAAHLLAKRSAMASTFTTAVTARRVVLRWRGTGAVPGERAAQLTPPPLVMAALVAAGVSFDVPAVRRARLLNEW